MTKLLRPTSIRHASVIIILLILFLSAISAQAQPTQALVENWRNSDYGFISRMMDTDQNDNIYVLGFTAAGDYLVIKKFNPAGDLLWNITYNPAERLRGVWLAVDSNANPVVLASIVAGSNADPAGWVTIKYDTNGNLLWDDKLPGPFSDARRLEIDGANNIYVSGRMFKTNGFGNTTRDAVLIKYDPDGAALWTAVFDNNSAVDEPSALTISPDGSRIGVAGMSGNLFMALMYDPDGNLLWSDTNPNLYPSGDVAFGPGNISYFATGTYDHLDPNPYQMAIAKFDPTGNSLWVKSYPAGDQAYRVKVDNLGNVITTGIDQAGYIDWMTIKTDADGNLLWSQRYDAGRNNDEIPNMLLVDDLGAVYVTGTGGPNPGSGNISYLKGVVAKYNSDGLPQWAVYDDYAGGKALSLAAGDDLATIGFGYLVTTHYTQTGLPDLVPDAPSYLNGIVGFDGFNYYVNLNFTDNAENEFWVNIERCTGSGCTDFTKIGQSLGENSSGFRDETVSEGVTYTYRAKALGFMGESAPSNTIEVTIGYGNPPAAPGNLSAQMQDADVLLSWQDNSPDEEHIFIERCQGSGCSDFVFAALTNANSTSWLDGNVIADESYSYRVRAWNSHGFSAFSNIATIHTPAIPNNAPILDFIGDKTVVELSTLEFTVTASDPDVPPQSLTFTLDAGAPVGASIDPVSGVFTWTPADIQGPGAYPVTVSVTDNGTPPLSDTETFIITVNEVYQGVVVNAGLDQAVQEGQLVQFSGVFTETLLLGQPQAIDQVFWDFGDGMSATGSLDPVHAYGDNGSFNVTLIVTDTVGNVGSDSLLITSANSTPILPDLPDQVVKVNQLLSLPVTFTDQGWLDSHTVSMEWAPGITDTFELAAGVTDLTLQHTYSGTGQFTVMVAVSDKDGASDSRAFTVTVESYRHFLPQINR